MTAAHDDMDIDLPLKLEDWIEIVADDLDSAIDGMTELEVEKLVKAVRLKLQEIEGGGEPVEEPEPVDDIDY